LIKVMVSSCLLGEKVRWDGRDRLCDQEILAEWAKEGRLVPICPELAGGLPVPRPPAEIAGGDGRQVLLGKARVIDNAGRQVTDAFLTGAHRALDLAQQEQVHLAVLTEKSPSCGSSQVYRGKFDGSLIAGMGVTAALLQEEGIRVFSEHQLAQAAACLREMELASK